MNRKRQLIFITLLLVVSGLRAQTLVLHHADGSTTDVELFTQPRVQFQNDKVLITSTVLNMEYAKQDVLRFTYKGSSLGVSSPSAKANVSHENGQLVFHGIKSTDKIAVYTANGIRVPVTITRSGSDAAIQLNAIPKGVYMLKVNNRTSKFTRP